MTGTCFDKVSYKYTADEFVFENYSLDISPLWNNILIVGNNGSGKSTIGKLFCGLLHPTSGDVLINGVNLRSLKIQERIKHAYLVTQISQLSFVKNAVIKEIELTSRISQNLFNKTEYLNFGMPDDLYINPYDLSVNESWRLGLYLGYMVKPALLYIDEIPSLVSNKNKFTLEYVLSERKRLNLITILSYHRNLNVVFDHTITVRP